MRLLPYEDALLKAYKETRYRFFGFDPASPALKHVINGCGEAVPCILVDGEVIGTWSWNSKPNQPIVLRLPFHQFHVNTATAAKCRSGMASRVEEELRSPRLWIPLQGRDIQWEKGTPLLDGKRRQ